MPAERLLSKMHRRLAPAAPTVAVALALATAGEASAQKTCAEPRGDGRHARFVRVTGVSCAQAQALIRKVVVKAPAGCLKRMDDERSRLTKPCRVSGYRCTGRGISENRVIDAVCKRGAKVVRFQY